MGTRKEGYVYFLVLKDPRDAARDLGLVKIGITSGDVSRRIATLQTGNPYDLLVLHSLRTKWPREVEHFMHRVHANEMFRSEWVRCTVEGVPALIEEASVAAERIERRKSREAELANTVSHGQVRRATLTEFELHREARRISRHLIPAQLKLQTVEAQLHAATADASGIEGVVRVRFSAAFTRFDSAMAETLFPSMTADCQRSTIKGSFRWRRMFRPTDFPEEFEAAVDAKQRAAAEVAQVLRDHRPLSSALPRTASIEGLHNEYLQLLPVVKRLEGDLADVRTELLQDIGEYDALDPVCSFVRRQSQIFDLPQFRSRFPAEYERCLVSVDPQIRKVIYPSRSYLPLED